MVSYMIQFPNLYLLLQHIKNYCSSKDSSLLRKKCRKYYTTGRFVLWTWIHPLHNYTYSIYPHIPVMSTRDGT